MDAELVQGMNKETAIGMLKSKTINVNAALTIIIIALANAYGVPLTPVEATAVVSLIYGIANIILRFYTTKSLPEKGVTIANPVEVQKFVIALENNPEALEKLYTAIAKWKESKIQSQKFSKAMEMQKGV